MIPPIIAEPIEAGSGDIFRPCFARMSFTRCPTIPGWRSMALRSSDSVYSSQFFPATIRIESLIDWPDSEVPAARNVTAHFSSDAARRIADIAFSVFGKRTISGTIR